MIWKGKHSPEEGVPQKGVEEDPNGGAGRKKNNQRGKKKIKLVKGGEKVPFHKKRKYRPKKKHNPKRGEGGAEKGKR